MHPLFTSDSAYGELVAPRKERENPEFDITAMIDLVFMMNIYFLVTFIGAALGELDLPAANHCVPLDGETATTITVVSGRDGTSAVVYLGDREQGNPIYEAEDQEAQIAAAVEEGAARGLTAVLVKAEKQVRLREINRIASAASREGVTLHIAVMEKDSAP